jgi:hypothetical protein
MSIDLVTIGFLFNQIPLIIFFIVYKKLEKVQKYFGLFLFWGFLHDLKGLTIENSQIKDYLYVFYVLTEVSFYAWFLFRLGQEFDLSKRLKPVFFILLVPFWIAAHFVFEDPGDNDIYSGLFDGITACVISSLSAYLIFRYTQKNEKLILLPEFWFLSGIFFYFFCNIFIFGIMSKEVAMKAWVIHRIINFTTMICYSVAFLLANRFSSKFKAVLK